MEMDTSLPTGGKRNTLAFISGVLGGLSLLGGLASLVMVFMVAFPVFICASISGLLALGAIITGAFGLVQVNRVGSAERGRMWAIAGIAMGSLGLLAVCVVPLISALIYSYSGFRMPGPIPSWRN